MSEPARILVVDDEADMLETCSRILVRQGYDVTTAPSPARAVECLETTPFHLMITDLVMPGMSGLELAQLARKGDPSLAILMITAHASVETALRATREGAFDYIPKPFSMEDLETAVRRALEYRRERLVGAGSRQPDAVFDSGPILGNSPAIQRTLARIPKVADTASNILIVGESGTGKELVARAVHLNSRRRLAHFVPLDCGALPEMLLESELFGAERGAYTSADAVRRGVMEYADGGTLFLDEIANLPLAMQAKLLRALEARTVRRVGGTREIAVDVRLIAATHQDLAELVAEGRFRADLYYRLHVVEITIPPLRERDGDVRLLALHFASEFGGKSGRQISGVSSAALMMLERYDWPGNVRELRNAIERAVSLTESSQIMPDDLPPDITEPASGRSHLHGYRAAKERAVTEFEVNYLRLLMAQWGGNISRAAAFAGLKRTALHRLLARHHLRASEFRPPHGHSRAPDAGVHQDVPPDPK